MCAFGRELLGGGDNISAQMIVFRRKKYTP